MLQKSTLDLPVSLLIRSVKSVPFKSISHPVEPSSRLNRAVVVGNLSDVDWYLVGKNNAPKMPLTEHKPGHILHP